MFNTLTGAQQVERLTWAAHMALDQYGLSGAALTLENHVNNAVFRVDAADERFALRIHRAGLKRRAWIESELAWLTAIAQAGTLCAPVPVTTRAGDPLGTAQVEGINEPVSCALFRWIEGMFYGSHDYTTARAEALGHYMGRLHTFTTGWPRPVDFTRPALDWEGLFGQESPYNPGDGARIFSADQVAVFDAVAERTRAVMGSLSDDFGLIHADMIAKNVLFRADGTACAIDFDDCCFGYYLYDLAPALLGFSDAPGYAELKAALWRGYVTERPGAAGQDGALETLVAARHVASCRWIAGNLGNPAVRARAPQIIAARADELRDFLRTGRLERRSMTL